MRVIGGGRRCCSGVVGMMEVVLVVSLGLLDDVYASALGRVAVEGSRVRWRPHQARVAR